MVESSTLCRSLELMNKAKGNPLQSKAVVFAVMEVNGFHCDLATIVEVGKDSDSFDKLCIRTVFNKIVPPNLSCHMDGDGSGLWWKPASGKSVASKAHRRVFGLAELGLRARFRESG